MAYVTEEGEVLGSIIVKNMIDMFGSRKDLHLIDDDFVRCFSENKEGKIHNRVDGMKSYIAIRNSIVEYVSNYSYIDTVTTGISKGEISGDLITISESDDVHLTGYLDLYTRKFMPADDRKIDNFYNFYALPNIFNMHEDADVKKNIETLFGIIMTWLTFPIIPITVSGIGKGVLITSGVITPTNKGKGVMSLGVNEKYPEKDENKERILSTIVSELSKIVLEQTPNSNTSKASELYWNTVATGLIEYMNINTVSTVDTGIGQSNYLDKSGVTIPEVTEYEGASLGAIVFGSTLVSKVVFDMTVIPIQLALPFKLDLPKICYKKTIVDEWGVEKEITVCLSFRDILTNIANLVEKITEVVVGAIKDAIDFLTRILNGVLTKISEIVEIITDAISFFVEGAMKFIASVFAHVTEFINDIIYYMTLPIVKSLRAAAWAFMQLVKYLQVAYEGLRNITFVKKTIEGITIVATTVIKAVQAVIDFLNMVMSEIGGFVTYILDKLSEIEFDNTDNCELVRIVIEVLNTAIKTATSLIVVPTIPTIPTIPPISG